jgi:hypothetical protein
MFWGLMIGIVNLLPSAINGPVWGILGEGPQDDPRDVHGTERRRIFTLQAVLLRLIKAASHPSRGEVSLCSFTPTKHIASTSALIASSQHNDGLRENQ